MFQKKKNQVEFLLKFHHTCTFIWKILISLHYSLFLSRNKVCPSIYLYLFSFRCLSFVFLCFVYILNVLLISICLVYVPPCYVSIIATSFPLCDFKRLFADRFFFFQIPIQQHCSIISLVAVDFPFILLGFLSRHNYNFVFSLYLVSCSNTFARFPQKY